MINDKHSLKNQPFRIGFGEDIHRLVPSRELWLGGVHIPFDLGLDGHSDADVLIHAIMDAMLGALAFDDIGALFPNTDPQYKGISSLKLLRVVQYKVEESGYRIGNIDSLIICEKPKISPFRIQIKNTLAEALGLEINQISVKAGTNEELDSIGRGEAIAARAVVMLIQ
ncbi:MAG: 2-C-methyl-D-erythritol 2,4-cyclodiphosphate synthase [Candidatus Riflebacteria bacterium]|nr:2-C-methyl-D-erythritol 2,4-cyclodiphosphate synthase [Candidatus Riflebacteria bacterium]